MREGGGHSAVSRRSKTISHFVMAMRQNITARTKATILIVRGRIIGAILLQASENVNGERVFVCSHVEHVCRISVSLSQAEASP